MSAADPSAQSAEPDRPLYHEPARSYVSSWVLAGVLLAGFILDLVLGGGLSHGWAWLIALVLVVGADALVTHAGRVLRSVTVTGTEVRVGEHAVARESITGMAGEVDPSSPVLGQGFGNGLARGVPGLAVRLVDGEVLVVPTRHPDRLAAALAVTPDGLDIRPAEPGDLLVLPDIDRRAEAVFRVAGFELPDIEFPAAGLRAAKVIFVAGRPAVGFVWLDEVGGIAHIEELAVVPGRMRQGLGTALLDAACRWAAAEGYPAITLTTFADVAWNGPFYTARGFEVLADVPPELAQVRAEERAAGLDAVGRRVAMRRELG